ncbi:sulfur carrier protein ThiS [Diaphorobacter sp.]|uniref:sulfur carrier protein ThiS n=1 Tax=Diaphorobacter sp. TaxID=1934310 RepID=UPI0028AEAE04|nr:sulfur carrier protein ThiS [Diaphorobacter sp.]
MNVTINQKNTDLPDNATVADAVAHVQAKPPFAVAVNTQFVPKTRYAEHALAAGDAIEIISPVTGG